MNRLRFCGQFEPGGIQTVKRITIKLEDRFFTNNNKDYFHVWALKNLFFKGIIFIFTLTSLCYSHKYLTMFNLSSIFVWIKFFESDFFDPWNKQYCNLKLCQCNFLK